MREEPADSTSKAGEAQPEPDIVQRASRNMIGLGFVFVSSISRDILEIWIVDHFAMGLSILIPGLVFYPFYRKGYTFLRWARLTLLFAAIATLVSYYVFEPLFD